jgi:hypothetical protein
MAFGLGGVSDREPSKTRVPIKKTPADCKRRGKPASLQMIELARYGGFGLPKAPIKTRK